MAYGRQKEGKRMLECATCKIQTALWIRHYNDQGEIEVICLDCYEGQMEFVGSEDEDE
jgi:hypothetical protein